VEREYVFEETHALVLDWLNEACWMGCGWINPMDCVIRWSI